MNIVKKIILISGVLCSVYPPETLFTMAVLLGCSTLVFGLGLILIGLGYIFAVVGVNKLEKAVNDNINAIKDQFNQAMNNPQVNE